ncbi:MAG: M24 family metallopeptidase [Actinomycetota bacterium]|nr:M24 family metallopeptidase [Actinomycetota bacterium]
MTTFLAYEVPARDPVLRHEIGEPVADPCAFIDQDGKRTVVASAYEEDVFARREDVVDQFVSSQELGVVDLETDAAFPQHLIGPEIVRRALERVGATSAVIPPSFPVVVADYLRDKQVDLSVDAAAWGLRRRRKNPWELEAIERAQRAAETAMLAAVHMLRDSEPTMDGRLRFEGEIVTAELLREAMGAELLTQGAESDSILIQSGSGPMMGHALGTGPILPDETCIIDCFPRERKHGAFSDMTRTFVPGRVSQEIKSLHADCRAALEIAFEALRPGASDAYRKVAEFLNERGHPTRLHHQEATVLKEGFNHSLGHGVGLEVHEPPSMGIRSDALVEGDVVAIEPGLYYEGLGGIRLEDTVIVTGDGAQHFSDPYPYDLEP